MWANSETKSGPGSTMNATTVLRDRLPFILELLNIKSILDLPCGDLNFMQHVDLTKIDYTGADIVADLIEKNKVTFCNKSNMKFLVCDAMADKLPDAELLFCRDMMIHFPNDAISKFLENVKRSNINWLLTSHFTSGIGEKVLNQDIKFGYFRPVNLTQSPFNLPKPLLLIPEVEQNKMMGLWKIR